MPRHPEPPILREDKAPSVTGAEAAPRRVHVVFITNEISPYRAHKLRRFADEVPGVRVTTLNSHESGGCAWDVRIPPQIGYILLGRGRTVEHQLKVTHGFGEWRNGGRIIQWLRGNPPDAVVIFGYGDAGHIRVIRWCHARGIPLLMWGDSNILGDLARGWRARLKRALVTRIVRWCDAVLACGRYGRQYFERYGAPPDKIFLVPNEPDYDQIFRLPPQRIQEVAAQFGLPSGRRRLLFVGRLLALKRVDLLINAFAEIAPRRPEWDLLVIGDGPMRGTLQQLVPPDLASRVKWGGFVSDQETVSALYRLCDVLVLPSEREAWALVLNEAAAAGLAVVASSVVGATPELVRDGVNGRVFPSGDQAALTACLLDVTDPARVDVMKGGSPEVLAEWRRKADPIQGLCQALQACGIRVGSSDGPEGAR